MIHGKYIDGDIDCKVSAEVISEVENVKFDFEKNPYYLLLAAGKSLKGEYVNIKKTKCLYKLLMICIVFSTTDLKNL